MSDSSDPRQRLGRAGEVLAEEALVRAGMTILDRRFRCREGEIDLVAEEGPVLVFVEVKARRGIGYGRPAEAVTWRKRARMARVALRFLATRGWFERRCRFDVVEVLEQPSVPPRVRHIRDAFRLGRSG